MHINDVRNLTGEQRLRLGLLLSELGHELVRQRIREARPEWSELRVRIEFFRIIFLPQPLPRGLQQRFMEECDQFHPEDPIEPAGLLSSRAIYS